MHFDDTNTSGYTADQLKRANDIIAQWCIEHADDAEGLSYDTEYKCACERALVAVEQ